MALLTGKENHYEFIERVGKHVQELLKLQYNPNDISVAHGDKCYGYRFDFNKASVPFNHGALIYLFTHMKPYNEKVRQTEEKWVDPGDWVIEFYNSQKGKELQKLLNTLG